MKLGSLWSRLSLLHLRELKAHPVRAAMVTLGIATATTLLVTVLALGSSITGAVSGLGDAFGPVDLVVRGVGDRGLDSDAVDDVAAIDDVEVAAPVVQATVRVDGQLTYLLGAGPEAAALGVVDVECLDGPRADLLSSVVAGPSLAASREVSVVPASGASRTVPVAGSITCPGVDRLNAGRFIAAVLPLAQELSGRPDRVDAVLVDVGEGADVGAVQAKLRSVVEGRGTVDAPGVLTAQAERAVMPFQQGLMIVTLLSLLVAGFLTFDVVTIAIHERRQDLATLWALGARPRPVLAGLVVESALLGAMGAVLGCALGLVLSRRLVGELPAFLVDTVGVQPSFHPRLLHLAAACALGVGATVIASAAPARFVLHRPSVASLRPGGAVDVPADGGVHRRIAGAGAVLLVRGLAVGLAVPKVSVVGLGAAIVGLVAISFGAADVLARLASLLVERFGVAGRLAALGVGRAPRRVWSTTTAVAIAVAVVITTGNLAGTQVGTFDRMWRSLAQVDVWAQTVPAGRAPLGPRFDPGALERVAALPGVNEVSGGWSMRVDLEGRNITLDALLPGSRSPRVLPGITGDPAPVRFRRWCGDHVDGISEPGRGRR